jgi:hypothetical protein
VVELAIVATSTVLLVAALVHRDDPLGSWCLRDRQATATPTRRLSYDRS